MSSSPAEAADAALTCPACGSVVAASVSLCAACGSKLTVELSVAPIGDPKRAYQVARLVAEFAGSAGAVAAWAKTLQAGTLRVTSPRGFSDTVGLVSALAAQGAQAAVRLTAPASKAPQRGHPLARVAAVTLVVAAVAGGAAWYARDSSPPVAPAAAAAAQPGVAAAPATPPQTAQLAGGQAAVAAEAEAPADAPVAPNAQRAIDFDAIRQSIVLITTSEGTQGTGFVVAPGVIVTNRHVIGRLTMGQVVDVTFGPDGTSTKASARIARVAKRLDLAVIQCGGECEALPALALGRLASTPLGATVYALGNPFGLTLTLSKGIVSSKERNLDGILFVQSDVSVNPGNSGGPLFNERGEVLGVVTAKSAQGEGITFVLPIEYAVQGGDPVLDGFVPVAAEFSADMLAAMERAGVSSGEEARYAARSSGLPDEELQLGAAAMLNASGTAYGVRFLLRIGPASMATKDGPFYLVIEQAAGGRGVYPMPDMSAPRKVGESAQAGDVYLYEYRGTLPSGARLTPGDRVAVRFNDDRFSNKVELAR